MMRSTLLFTITLLLTACSDNTTNKQLPTSSTTEKKATVKKTETAKTATPPTQLKETPIESKKEEVSINGHTLYALKCASCHGQSGEKSALNKSQVISGWETQRSVKALKGYQDGSYGNQMKGIMKGQVSTLSDAQIQAISAYIATL